MTEVDDDVRAALHSPTGWRPTALDVDQIMKSGTRLRRRRTAVRSAAALSVLALFLGGATQLTGQLTRSDHPNTPAATTSATPGAVLRIKDTTSTGLTGAPLGTVISTGLHTGQDGKEWLIYGVSGKGLNEDSYAFAIGTRKANDIITADYLASEWSGHDNTAPGFHPMQGDASFDNGSILPAFGYYVGTPARITATYDGTPVTAHTTRWSHNPGVTVFWFDTNIVNGNADKGGLTNLKALDAAGNKMPQGHLVINPP